MHVEDDYKRKNTRQKLVACKIALQCERGAVRQTSLVAVQGCLLLASIISMRQGCFTHPERGRVRIIGKSDDTNNTHPVLPFRDEQNNLARSESITRTATQRPCLGMISAR